MTRSNATVVVIGGANMDIKGRIAGRTVMATSNPGTMATMPGGVARNMAETLGRLGARVALISAVGRDSFGDRLVAEATAIGIDTRRVLRASAPTGTYTAILDSDGELLAGVAAMDILSWLTPQRLARASATIAAASLIVVDSNLPIATLDWIIGFAATHDRCLAIETVSVPKAAKIGKLLKTRRPLFALFCNRAELEALVGAPLPTRQALREGARRLHDKDVRHIGIGLGPQGMLTSSVVGDRTIQCLVPPVTGPLVEVTGAGDAAVAGTLHGLLDGRAFGRAAMYGQAAAALTRASPHSVSPRLSARALDRLVRASFGPA